MSGALGWASVLLEPFVHRVRGDRELDEEPLGGFLVTAWHAGENADVLEGEFRRIVGTRWQAAALVRHALAHYEYVHVDNLSALRKFQPGSASDTQQAAGLP